MSVNLKEIEAASLKQLLDKGEVLLIDVREPLEYKEEHISKAQLFPTSSFDPRTIPDPVGKKLVFYCHLGRRSANAAIKWAEHTGTHEIYSLKGGLESWKEERFPTVADKETSSNVESQTYIWSGSLILLGIVLSLLISQWFLIIPGIVALTLVFSGLVGHCYLSWLLSKLPYNR